MTIENGIEFFLPVEEQPLSNLEIQAITALTGTAPQLTGTACWAIVRHEVFHSLLYKRCGSSSSMVVEIESATLLYGKVLKFVLVESTAVAIVQRYHRHQSNICKDGQQLPTLSLLRRLVRDNRLASFYMPVEELDELVAVYCSKISKKCIFVADNDFSDNVCGFLVPVLRDYRV